MRLADPLAVEEAAAAVADLATTDRPQVDPAAGELRFPVADPGVSAEAVRRLDARQLRLASIEVEQPSLDDVFLTLTGRPAASDPTDPADLPETPDRATPMEAAR